MNNQRIKYLIATAASHGFTAFASASYKSVVVKIPDNQGHYHKFNVKNQQELLIALGY